MGCTLEDRKAIPAADAIDFTTLTTLWQDYASGTRRLAFNATNADEWAIWHAQLRMKVLKVLGELPRGVDLQPRVLEERELPKYRLEKVAIQSETGISIPCYVLTPREIAPPYRPIIALHGHGSGGAAHLVGRVRHAETRSEEEAHIRALNYDYAHQLACHGYMVFVPEQRGFGERMETLPGMAVGDAMWQSSCRALAFNTLLLGKTLMGLRVWDVMRTLDYIASRPEEKVSGVGCVGLSGGGTTTLYAAAIDPRISVAVLSGAFSTFRSSIMSTIHCDCNYLPGIMQYAEMADIAGLIAPRPLLIEAGTLDPIFPIDAVREASQEVAQIYSCLGVPERFDQDVFEGGHRFSGNKTFAWFEQWLR